MVKPVGGTTEISVTTEGLGDDLPHPHLTHLFGWCKCYMGHGDTVDYCKINQMVMPVVAIVLDVVALLEQISIAHGTSYVAIDMTDAFFLF